MTTVAWSDDLFDRRSEAELLAGHIESVAQSGLLRGDSRAFTIAIDSGYGEGKSFFLRRFAQHLGENHPVANDLRRSLNNGGEWARHVYEIRERAADVRLADPAHYPELIGRLARFSGPTDAN